MVSKPTLPHGISSHSDAPNQNENAATIFGQPSYASDRGDGAARRSVWRVNQRHGDTGFSASGATPGQSAGGQDQYGWGGFPQTEASPASSSTDADYQAWREKQIAAYDADYLTWREAQMRRHDEDYRTWLQAQAAADVGNKEHE